MIRQSSLGWLLGVAVLLCGESSGQGTSRVIPGDWSFRADIQSPTEFGGHPFGSRHWPHHRVVDYMKYLAEHSERAVWHPYARSHGGRELGFLTISSIENNQQLDSIRQSHRRLAHPHQSQSIELDKLPLVIQMGYGVHGDESSATHASVPVAYLLAAGEGDEIERWLKTMVIRLDPSLNPDGFDRFSHWVNENRGRHPSRDSLDREHRQPWPGGRVNYYWFDLNRDWLPAVHPESQGRLREYHRWKPNVVLDFHEMGTESTFFFQPGVPKRTHPLSPQRTRELTRQFADYHAQALDQIDSLYFTEERFDDFYPGKGSTYPDLHGAVGILFEQGSSRGNVQESGNGDVLFWKTIRNQVTTSLSSLRASYDLRLELLENQRSSYADALEMASSQPVRAYAFSAPGDLPRLQRFAELLARHDIQCGWQVDSIRGKDVAAKEIELPKWSLIVPTDQPEYRMLRTIVDRPTTFEESIFYDVSAWSLPLAYDLDQIELSQVPEGGLPIDAVQWGRGELNTDANVVAYAMRWSPEDAAKDLTKVLGAGLRAKVASEAFTAETAEGLDEFAAGTIVVPIGIQQVTTKRVQQVLGQRCETTWVPLTSGLTPQGIDLGSGNFLTLESPRILLVAGEGMSRYDVGALWHWFDTHLGMTVTMVEGSDLSSADMHDYNLVVMAGGQPAGVTDTTWQKVDRWLSDGGTLISIGTTNNWLASKSLVSLLAAAEPIKADTPGARPQQFAYAQAADDRALELLSGIIVEGQLDVTHPLGWGHADARLPLFRNHKTFLQAANSPYANPVIYAESPLMAGYALDANIEQLKKSVSVAVYARGQGRVIAMAEMPVFRGFFRGSARLFNNAVFFGPLIRNR